MRQIADLHIHSKYSRACSRDLVLEKIDEWCKYKGIDIVATGDFTHPAWFGDIKKELEPLGNGLFKLKKEISSSRRSDLQIASSAEQEVRFILCTEISCIYKQGEKTRRIHLNIFFPEIKNVENFNSTLEKMGCNLKSDGRPIIGLSSIELAKVVFSINEKAMLIPAHAWTPWFSIFGSKSGFDSIEECFGKFSKNIFAIETGLSSDPPMNWRLSDLDKITLVSNSDAHSLPNLGREANVFDFEDVSYNEIYQTLKNQDKKKFLYTIEFYPEEGKYHYDGHANHNFSLTPKETKKNKGICPVCKKPLTIGVLHRVDDLADREEGELDKHIPFKSLVPLQEIIAESFNVGKSSKRVQAEYFNIIKKAGTEFAALLDLNLDELKKTTLPEVVEAIKRVREGKLIIEPGYDGIYGKVKIFNDKERKGFEQAKLI
ncbi:MAG: endonuclease Q family protein [Candidatus Parcubacteria bacterium]|nr:endonuclease Q family protein [Candidatus Parcubacteria bacterium]